MRWKLLWGIGIISCAACGSDTSGPQDSTRFRSLFNTLYSGFREPARVVISDSVAWTNAWHTFHGDFLTNPPPRVDFREEQVVIIAIGEFRRAGHTVALERVEHTAAERVLHFVHTAPGTGCTDAEVITTPLEAAVVGRSTKPTRFEERAVIQNC